MYSGADLERFYWEYQSEWVPHGMRYAKIQQTVG